jgi:hypothetical protein
VTPRLPQSQVSALTQALFFLVIVLLSKRYNLQQGSVSILVKYCFYLFLMSS